MSGVPWSGSIVRLSPPGGRYIYPAIGSQYEETKRAAAQAIEEIYRAAGWDVT